MAKQSFAPPLRRAVSPRRRLVLPEDIYPVDPWRIVERQCYPRFLPQTEAIFCTSNGYLGIRGTPEEGAPVHESGTYLNGFYETWPIVYGEEAYGFAKLGQTMLAVPDGTLLKLYVDDEPLELEGVQLLSFERVLDMRRGILERTIQFETPDGKRLAVHTRRLVSLTHRHLACICYEVSVLGGDASLTVSSELATSGRRGGGGGDPRRVSAVEDRALIPTNRRARQLRALLNLRTRASGLRMACAMDHVLDANCPVEIEEAECIEDRARVVFLAQAHKGSHVCIVKFLAYHHSASAEAGELRFRTNRTLDRAMSDGFERLLVEQERQVEAFWDASDVEIEGAPDVQQAVRFNLFQVMQASIRVEGFGIPAKGLSGLGYEGHYFWDTEIYVMPFLTYTRPHIARALLHQRVAKLDLARQRAREVGEKGALYPDSVG